MNRKPLHIRHILSFLLIVVFFSFAYIGISKTSVFNPTNPEFFTANIISAAKQEKSQDMQPIIMVGIQDTILSAKTAEFISQNNIKGVLLLWRNIQSKEQLKKLTSDIHSIGPNIQIAIDQEGGEISRISFSQSELTPQKDIQTESEAYVIAYKRAQELTSYGIDINFSPVADFITDKNSFLYNRTFQKDPDTIAVLAGAMLRGYQDGGITPVLKHFPGHTNDSADTHDSVVTISASKEDLAKHILPFKKIISRFNPPAIMVGGSIYTAYDSTPAALSKTVLKDMLRQELGFTGVIISDDLEMDAFSQYSLKDRALRALEAGCNIIIFSQTKTTQEQLSFLLQDIRKRRP